jgi:diphthine synthase
MENRRLGLHTLCLLDIKVKEPEMGALAQGKLQYEAPRYMTVSTQHSYNNHRMFCMGVVCD